MKKKSYICTVKQIKTGSPGHSDTEQYDNSKCKRNLKKRI